MSYMDTLANEKPAIVIDIGQAYTKCGFSGEVGPHSIIPTRTTHELTKNRTIKLHEYKKLMKYDIKKSSAELDREETDILRELLIEFLYRVYYKTLNSNARERKVVIVESVLTSSFFRKTLSDVLFKNYQAVSVMFMPSHLAALYTLGTNMGLVLDCGYTDCQIMPIAESVPMIGQVDFMNLGGHRIHTELDRLIKKHAYVTKGGDRVKFMDSEPAINLTEDTLEDIKLRCCFVTTLQRSREFWSEVGSMDGLVDKSLSDFTFKFAPDCDYNLDDNIVLHVPGYIREMAFEFLFIDNVDGNQTIPHLILDTLLKCPIDLKKPLSENVVLMGGTCLLEGFKSRLVSEVNFLLGNEEYSQKLSFRQLRYHVPPCVENYTAWLGGSIFGHLDVLDTYSIQLAKYKENKTRLPDWFTVYDRNETVQI